MFNVLSFRFYLPPSFYVLDTGHFSGHYIGPYVSWASPNT